ncbi:hypothetical protein PsYK624_098440 [Phanerochaete sordida]|uniref:Uncharacterized protein n=1 Tax=Phanerochaete sordida TaxID=48140 RepID=A0A9P3LGJ0_9APHY|nr:hypothetical protein PsYK624_098440 [Phanerochaete sordida]
MPPPFPELRELELFAIAPRVLDAIFHLYQSSRIISWPRLQTLILPPQATIPESTLLRFVKHRTQIGYPVSTIKASAQTLKELSREALAILASHPVQLICHAEDAGSHRLYEIWDVTRNVPVYLPWHGSLRWWDQF